MSDKTSVSVDAQGCILVPLGGADYQLRPDHQAIMAIESQLGRSLIQLSGAALNGLLTTQDMAVICAEMMKAVGRYDEQAGPSYKGARADRLAELIYEAGAPRIMARLGVILTEAVTGGYTAKGERRPATT